MSSMRWMGFALFGLTLVACELRWKKSEESRPEPSEVFRPDLPPKGMQLGLGGGPLALDAAVERLVDARCRREAECSRVGPGRHFSDTAACAEQARGEFRALLNVKDCPESVEPTALDACLAAERSAECGGVTLQGVSVCSASTMCRKPHN